VGALISVTEVVLHCKTTNGIVEKRFKHDAEVVQVSRWFARRSALTHRLQLQVLDLTEVPSELFRMKNVKELSLFINKLCSLPSDIAHLAKLEELHVRSSKRSGHDLTKRHRSPRTSSRLFRPSSVC
jgi:hypothetical protein